MGTKQAFKTYARTQRIQDTNVTFAKGMSFTDSPLIEGFSRLLVNLDFDSDSGCLKPRRGFQTLDNGYYKSSLEFKGPDQEGISDGMSIVAANQVTHQGKVFYQVIIGRLTGYSNEGSSHRETYVGDAWVLTLQRVNDTPKIISYECLNDINLSQKCIFVKPSRYSGDIHGVPLEDSEYIKRHIGVFAFNSAYYYFTTDGRLHYTYFDTTTECYAANTVTPYSPLQYETQNSLYNMLLYDQDPYAFSCSQVSGVLRLTGFAPCDKNTKLFVLSPQAGIEYDYKLYYTYPTENAKYCLHIEYSKGNDTWFTVNRDEKTKYEVSTEPFNISGILVNDQFVQFRIYAIEADKAQFTDSNQLTLDSLAKSVLLTASFNYIGASKADSITNLQLTRYDLSHANVMTYWKNRIWLAGAAVYTVDELGNKTVQKQDNTILFASEPNRPDWFPYTAGADVFDEEIIHLQPMLDELLVFTTHNLYSLTLDSEGISWTKKHLQANLNLTPWDLNLIQTVKNMVFFKSGNYYYMVVPKLTSASGAGLAIAPVSKNISGLLDNFKSSVEMVIDDLFNYSCVNRFKEKAKTTYDLKLIHYYNYLDYEDVHNNYVFEVTKRTKTGYSVNTGIKEDTEKVLLTFSLLYNTVTRTWRIYTIESNQVLVPLIKDATDKGLFISMLHYKEDLLLTEPKFVAMQVLQYTSGSGDCSDRYIKVLDSIPTPPSIFKNWQYYDSGNLEQNTDMKKRFREYQFKIVNNTKNLIKFYSGFFLDKATRTYEMYYEQENLLDQANNEVIAVIDGVPTFGLQGDPKNRDNELYYREDAYLYTELGSWSLDTSQFPNTNTWKIRVPTSGKGYLPRIVLISYNQTSYEFLSCATVYRQLYSR